ncbi:hypothetical protein DEIPH_ctg010orf0011 [Deinococcus phoenicis]|uniref:Polymorphic outer membrane protein n=1 Tax=Deinococcus phoenicis TaxID=1476583 RepID=A0A016QT52_9DEIO|nr:hypothetical protein [Deinococcus phoenicis]EYB69248.1 hypothetical protein DEIPH_ctg010orf0011 [Deinococcus phoenicis]
MRNRTAAAPLAALSLGLLLSACGGGGEPLVGTPIPSTADSGAGSLREVLAAAKDGDTLRFTTTGTVTLASPITVDKDVTVLAEGVTLDAGGQGRALEVASGAEVTLKGGTLMNGQGQPVEVVGSTGSGSQALSKATWGGVIHNRGNLILDGTTVADGKAMNGGGIYNDAGASLTLRSVVMKGNEAFTPSPDLENESTGSGGAIANQGTLTIESGTFQNNTAYYTGGVLRHSDDTATLTIKGGLFENNTCTFPEAADGNNGCLGGVALLAAAADIQGGTFRNNTATLAGGALYVSATTKPTVTLSGGTFEGNKASGPVNSGGGAVLNAGNLTISGGTFTGNSALYGGALNNNFGGALKITGGSFTGNTAQRLGGVLLAARRGTSFEMTGGSMSGNTAGQNGGAINLDGTGSMTGGVIENNAAQDSGGGLMLYAQAGQKTTVTLGGTLILRGNTAKNGGGVNTGSADPDGTTVNIQAGHIENNAASQAGGGLFVGKRVLVNLSGGTVNGNQAVVTGGGVAMSGTLNMTGGTISGNSVAALLKSEGGGGVRMYTNAVMTASGGSINDNISSFGGGVLVGGAFNNEPAAQFTLAGATVSGNRTVITGGGFFNDGKLTIQSGTVTGNTTGQQGGGGVRNTANATYAQTGGSVTGNTPDDVSNE